MLPDRSLLAPTLGARLVAAAALASMQARRDAAASADRSARPQSAFDGAAPVGSPLCDAHRAECR